MRNPLLTNYKVGLILSRAGLNPAQVAEVRHRISTISRASGEPVQLTVPNIHHEGPAGADAVEKLLLPLRGCAMTITIAEDVCSVPHCLQLFKNHDEVWCCPSIRQTLSTQARAYVIHHEANKTPDGRRYKIIPPWVLPPVAEAKETKTKAMKG